MIIEGTVIRVGDNIDTDVIIPARYLTSTDPLELARHCMEGLDPDFLKRAGENPVIVAGKNFGCGSSREHAPLAIKGAGVEAVIAASFARIFYRNALNIGLPILESEEATKSLQEGHRISIDLENGTIKDKSSGAEFTAQAFPPLLKDVIRKGGLLPYIKERLEKEVT